MDMAAVTAPIWIAGEVPGKPSHAHEILSAIISHHTVPSTLQMVADSFRRCARPRRSPSLCFPARSSTLGLRRGYPSGFQLAFSRNRLIRSQQRWSKFWILG